ncbi:Eco57I restriction-modification methylase domain-containing protein [Mobiluncus mulieris]
MAQFRLGNHNPDVLNCIANLSNDEVFTPPRIANVMLDQVATAWAGSHDGASIWANPEVKFLDPCTKSGAFLREITRRLVKGLCEEIPDLQQRVNHILTQQVYGMGITSLTALLTRRSVYCSKWASREHSICRDFNTDDGNIWFERTEHNWVGGKAEAQVNPTTGQEEKVATSRRCSYCGAGEDTYSRGDSLETHAYAFIHSDNIQQRLEEIFGADMHFDVVIGNPPYQISTEGYGKQARPIYQEFIAQAKKLDPSYLTMIIPSRWFTGGMGLDEFRDEMLSDSRLRSITDYLTASEVFSGVGLKGGVCYFLWERDNPGECEVTTHFQGKEISRTTRPLLEPGADVFIRFNDGISVLKKVVAKEGSSNDSVALPPSKCFTKLVSSIGSYGIPSKFAGREKSKAGDLKVYRKGGFGYISASEVKQDIDSFDTWKVFVGRAAPGTGNKDTYPHRILSTPFIGEPGSVSSWAYIKIGDFKTKEEARSVLSYLSCRLTRFLILLHKPSQDTTRKVYTFVPTQKWDHIYTDQELYRKYGLTDAEIAFIESIVRPLEVNLDGPQ